MTAVVKLKQSEETIEGKHQKFLEIAKPRMDSALDKIRLVGNLSNRATYEYSETEIKQMVKALEQATEDMAQRFTPASKGKTGFSF